ncbi:MAG: 4Fe-4S dicluster domain-containing protein [Chitinivibrionales bacterium]|nr:4Fe-4S dicluster domain-containing protein [Chitinivibrionales bacterium]
MLIDKHRCTHCGGCSSVCPERAIFITDEECEITDACTNCKACLIFCPVSAVVAQESHRAL